VSASVLLYAQEYKFGFKKKIMMFQAVLKGRQLQHLSEYERWEILDFPSVAFGGYGTHEGRPPLLNSPRSLLIDPLRNKRGGKPYIFPRSEQAQEQGKQ
jgi:hypothetical protein